MASKRPQQLRDKGNTEASASVIANWVDDEQPREGVESLRRGWVCPRQSCWRSAWSAVCPEEDAVQLARRLLGEVGGIQWPARRADGPFCGPRTAWAWLRRRKSKAIRELGVRDTESVAGQSSAFSGSLLRSPSTCVNAWARCPTRPCACLFLNAKKRAAWLSRLCSAAPSTEHTCAREGGFAAWVGAQCCCNHRLPQSPFG